jgi:uncharacterized protein (DUF1800 family)
LADRELNAAIAVTRFGMGAKPGEIAQAASDPQGWLRAQIRPEGAEIPQGNGEDAEKRLTDFRDAQQYTQMLRQQAAMAPPDAKPDAKSIRRDLNMLVRDDVSGDFLARTQLGAGTNAGFRERWALFFANHFTVSTTKQQTAAVIGPYEAEAIRPHVFGHFSELLASAETHPAMLYYLDQTQSVGPNSQQAQAAMKRPNARPPGLNENLAREIMELHTVGVNGGYTQADVTEFARAMTGLSVPGPKEAVLSKAVFREAAHEPGKRLVLGKNYNGDGMKQFGSILNDLAARPATARFVCTKIARHFVADDPPPSLVNRLQAAWMSSGGDLSRVAEALISAPEAWKPQAAKLKTPYEFVVSSYRALGLVPNAYGQVGGVLGGLGQQPFAAPSPKGWPEEAQAWATADAIVKRMQFAQNFSRLGAQQDPNVLAQNALGARLTPAVATAVARAESRPEAVALLIMSPEFQRR